MDSLFNVLSILHKILFKKNKNYSAIFFCQQINFYELIFMF
jgi:hypothetical protein